MARRVAPAARAFTPAFGFLVLGLVGCEGEPPQDPCAPRCERNAVAGCDAAGEPVRLECGALRCASDSPVPQCVPPTALPCDLDDAPPDRCENGRVVTCAPTAAYLLAVDCPEGSLCAAADTACRPAEEIRCDARQWAALCINAERFTCNNRGRVSAAPAACAD